MTTAGDDATSGGLALWLRRRVFGGQALRIVGDVEIDAQGRVVGWVFDKDRPELALSVDILVDGECIGSVLASDWSHIAHAKHPDATFSGFQFTLSDAYHDAKLHIVEARVSGAAHKLGGPLLWETVNPAVEPLNVFTSAAIEPAVCTLEHRVALRRTPAVVIDKASSRWIPGAGGPVLSQNGSGAGLIYGHRAYRTWSAYATVFERFYADPAFGGVYDADGRIWQASCYLANTAAIGHSRRLLAEGAAASLDGAWILFCNSVRDTYFHWHLDCLTSLMLAREVAGPGARVLAPRTLNAWQRRSLELLDVEVVSPETDLCRPERLIVASHIDGRGSRPDRWALGLFQALKAAAMDQRPPTGPTPRKLFISREDALHRVLRNEDELWRALQTEGFTRFVPSQVSYDEEIAMFAGADIVVASHGSALTNIGFCSPGAQIVEILPADYENGAIRFLAAAAGLNHFWYTTALVEPFAIDVPDFMRACRKRRLFKTHRRLSQ